MGISSFGKSKALKLNRGALLAPLLMNESGYG